jgi:hypothetical protein
MTRIKRHADLHRFVPRESAHIQSALSAGNTIAIAIPITHSSMN